MDRIQIVDLLLRCIVGINPDERREKQDVNITVTLFADLRPAGRSDDIADTVNYRSVKTRIRHFVEGSSFLLVEKLADGIACLCLEDPRVERVVVRVEKPAALRFARTVAVEIERRPEDYPDPKRHAP
ncbi:MAG: dihydroneopterin aldolase [Lentisphaerae bacterium RIFOXYB12_FULL_65_16]|nr:MAG: dihydroneopterin aldolase [Lentisphaerae bacterium RIFOXYA12_64_32]OGV86941.1 MAG: dihydroneopterin aldolase [Lentisphaerae bacterium RIFOXYB12_FULL_65_16]